MKAKALAGLEGVTSEPLPKGHKCCSYGCKFPAVSNNVTSPSAWKLCCDSKTQSLDWAVLSAQPDCQSQTNTDSRFSAAKHRLTLACVWKQSSRGSKDFDSNQVVRVAGEAAAD